MSLDLSMNGKVGAHPSLLEQTPEEDWTALGDMSFEQGFEAESGQDARWGSRVGKNFRVVSGKIFGISAKENLPA
jgi:hypothetical protein